MPLLPALAEFDSDRICGNQMYGLTSRLMAHQLNCTAIEPSKRSHTPPSRCIDWFNLRRLYQ